MKDKKNKLMEERYDSDSSDSETDNESSSSSSDEEEEEESKQKKGKDGAGQFDISVFREAQAKLLTVNKLNEIRRFDFNNCELDTVWMLYGKRNTGKTFYLRYLVRYLAEYIPYGMVFTQTPQNNFWQQHFPARFVIKGINQAYMQKVMEMQLKRIRDPNPLFLVILEDLAMEDALRYMHWLKEMAYAGRHSKFCLCITTQYPFAFGPGIRDNADYAVIFPQKSKRSRKCMEEQYGEELSPDSKEFLMCLDIVASKPFHVTVIDNVNKEGFGIDNVYWDVAEDPGPFRFGCDEYWGKTDWEDQLKEYPMPQPLDKDVLKQHMQDMSLEWERTARQINQNWFF